MHSVSPQQSHAQAHEVRGTHLGSGEGVPHHHPCRETRPGNCGFTDAVSLGNELFHRDAFGEVAWLVDLAAAQACYVIGEDL